MFLVLTTVGACSDTRARSRTHTQKHRSWQPQREKRDPRLLHRGCLAFNGCCSTSIPAAEVKHKQRCFGGLHGPGLLYLVGKRSRGYLPDCATLNTQSKRHGARPGPTLAPWCTGGSPAYPAAKSARKDPRPEEKKFCIPQKKQFYTRYMVVQGSPSGCG